MAISRDLTINVAGRSARFDKEVFLFQGDKNIDLYIEVIDSEYRYNPVARGNIFFNLPAGVTVDMKILKPNRSKLIFRDMPIVEDKIRLTITPDICDQLDEIGIHELQIVVKDNDVASKSIPSVQFEVLKPLFLDEEIVVYEDAIVDKSKVGFSKVTAESYQIGLSVNGDYVVTNWQTGDLITAAKLLKIENKLKSLGLGIDNVVSSKLDKTLFEEHIANHPSGGGETHTHTNKTVLDGITSTKVTEWNNKSTFDGNYNNLTNKPSIPVVDVTKSYVDTALTSKADKSTTYTKTEVDTKIAEASIEGGEIPIDIVLHKDVAGDGVTVPPVSTNVDIVDNLTSTSTTSALSANQGRVLNGEIESLKQSVSNGKNLVATAITDKGVDASGNDTFEVLADKISQIEGVVNPEPTYEMSIVAGTYEGKKEGIAYIDGACTYPNVTYWEVSSELDGWVGVANVLRSGKFELEIPSFAQVKTYRNCKIEARTKDDEVVAIAEDTFNLIVSEKDSVISVVDVTISPNSHIFSRLNDTVQLNANVTPSNATNKNVSWSSSDSSIVTVSAGLATAKSSGNAIITCTTNDGGHSSTCSITVDIEEEEIPNPSGKNMYHSIAFIPYPHESGWGAYDGLDQFKDYDYGSALICLPVDCQFANNEPFCDVTESLINSICNKAEGLGLEPILKMHTVSLNEDGQGNTDRPNNAQTWFANYRILVNKYADIAVKRGYKEFIISNEMHNVMNLASNRQYMLPIIADVKAKGLKVSMSMNTPEVVENDGFQYFDELDFYCMNTYPSLTHNQYSNEWARNNFETLKNGFYTVENSLDIDYATLFENMGGANNLHKKIWLTEVGANTSLKTLEYPAYWGDTSDPKTNYEGQKHWLHAVFDVLEKDKASGKLTDRVARYMLWDGNYGSNFNPIGKMSQEVLDMYWKETEPPTEEFNYFEIGNSSLQSNFRSSHIVDIANNAVEVTSTNEGNVDGYAIWQLPDIRKGRTYRITCNASDVRNFVRIKVDSDYPLITEQQKTDYVFEFEGDDAKARVVKFEFGIRHREEGNTDPIKVTFSNIEIVDVNGDPPPEEGDGITYDVVDYKIIVSDGVNTESYHSCDDVPRNLNGNGGVDGYKVIIKDGIKHYLSLTNGASDSKITIDGMKPFDYTYVDADYMSKWITIGYAVYHDTLKYTIANRVDNDEFETYPTDDRPINQGALERALSIYNCAIPNYMEITYDPNSVNSVSEGWFETEWLGICRLNHYQGVKFHIHQNAKHMNGFNNSSRFFVAILVHELGHTTGIKDHNPSYPTTYTYLKNQENEWLQPSDIACIKQKFPHLTGGGARTSKHELATEDKTEVLFTFKEFKNEKEMFNQADTVINVKFLNKEDESLYIYKMNYNLYNFEVTRVVKGNVEVKEIVQIKEHESFDLRLEEGNEYRLYLANYKNSQSCLLNPSQAILKMQGGLYEQYNSINR